jgi:hypothetical protein
LAEDWAIKTSGPVSGSEYSSKYHAGLASTSATSANDAKTAAESARDQTLAAYDQFDDRYLGTKASDPTVDNDGDPLVAGSLYFNSVSGVMRLYTGSAWVAAYVSGVASSVAVTPAGNIASTNVQTALQELDGEKQPTLVSGTNIKTVNSNSLLGSGDIAVQPTLVSGTNIKTVNSTSLLGSGNITIDTTPADASITPAKLSTGAPSWDSSGNLSFNSGYGSAATAYGCRAWVNFNGTGTIAIRASGNVSSITDNGAGDYTVNFTTALPDGNYAVSSILSNAQTVGNSVKILASNNTSSPTTMSTSACRLVYVTNTTAEDYNTITAMFVR